MLDSLGAIKELYEASKGGEVLAAINHAAKMTTSTLPFTGFSRSQIRSIPTRYDVHIEPVRLHNACITACNFKDAGPISANQKLRYR